MSAIFTPTGSRAVDSILAFVAERRGIDFRDYRPDTLRNRLEARARALGCTDVERYRVHLLGEHDEIDRLVEALVVPVTEFFRDSWVFGELADRVLPSLRTTSNVVRAWVVGCATGQEAYTVAMLLAESSAREGGRGFEVLASDLDERSLETARPGIYPEASVNAVPPLLRERYFRREIDGFRVAQTIRGRIQFAQHDLVGLRLAPAEAIIAAFDLILCRNVLIYFDGALRAKAVDRLAAALEPGGALMIGPSEALPAASRGRFEAYPGVSPGARIFRGRVR